MTFRPSAVVFLLAIVGLTAAPARAWNFTGHMTVALIAYRQLDDAEKQQIATLLKSHPHYERLLLVDRPAEIDAGEWAFLRASIWPDLVRPADPGKGQLFKGPEITRYHRGGWHVVQLPWIPPADRAAMGPATRYAPRGEHLLEALPQNEKTLASAGASPQDRAVALAWIEHLIGDLHQPLHACSMFSPQYPQGDNVGSGRTVRTPGGEVVRLHVFWDGQMGTSDAYAAFDFLARSITTDPRYLRAALDRLSRGDTPADWAQESHELAIAFAHLNGRLLSMPTDEYVKNQPPPQQVPALPIGYAENARTVAEQRIAQAGLRLAATVKSALAAAAGSAPASSPASPSTASPSPTSLSPASPSSPSPSSSSPSSRVPSPASPSSPAPSSQPAGDPAISTPAPPAAN
jgi:hypothetical protein